MPTIETVSPTLGREASQPTAPSTPVYLMDALPLYRYWRLLCIRFPATNTRFSPARNGMAPRRKEFDVLEILI